MQPQRIENDEVSPLPGRLVGARAANAAQRAAQAVHFTLFSKANSDGGAAGESQVEMPATRRVDAPANDQSLVTNPAEAPAPRKLPKRALIGLVAGLVLGASGWFGYQWFTVGRYIVSTDDAYVHADATTLAAKVSGYVAAIDVADNAYVHAGDVIARIDDGDYRLAADTARDKLATQQATVARIGKQIEAQKATVAQAKAQLASTRAVETRNEFELARQQVLAEKQFASRQTLEQAQSNRDQAIASVQSAQAALDAAGANVEVLVAQQQEAARQAQELKTAWPRPSAIFLTVIRAPIDGMIGNRAMQVGDYAQTGQRLASLVPLAGVYIDADFEETQAPASSPASRWPSASTRRRNATSPAP